MQALEWTILGGADFVQSAVIIGCGASHSAWQIGISCTQRNAIFSDPKWRNGNVDPTCDILYSFNLSSRTFNRSDPSSFPAEILLAQVWLWRGRLR
jgi:homoserine O-acetyltransferase